jgi:uncharacterized membrane protein YqhA
MKREVDDMRGIRDWFESVFETFLFNSRLIVILAVLGSLTSSVLMFVRGAILIVHSTKHFFHSWKDPHDEELAISLISSVDNFLFATVLLIFAMGIYELFISKIDPASRTEDSRPNWLQIHSLDDLKGAVGKVILMILIVRLFESAVKMKYDHPLHLLYLGICVLFVAAALYLQHLGHKHDKPHAEHADGDHAATSIPAPAMAMPRPAAVTAAHGAHAVAHHHHHGGHGNHGSPVASHALDPAAVTAHGPHGLYGGVSDDATMAMGTAPQPGYQGSPVPYGQAPMPAAGTAPAAFAGPPAGSATAAFGRPSTPSQVPQTPSFSPAPPGAMLAQASAPPAPHGGMQGPGPSQPPLQQAWPQNGPQRRGY